MKTVVTRNRVREQGIDTYNLILDTEDHHNHNIIKDEHGTLRWEENPNVRELVDIVGLNEILRGFYHKGLDKNSEEYRRLYRNIGYSLSGYWEIFYWEMNNEDADKYIGEEK